MKYTKKEIAEAYATIEQYRGCNIAATVNRVSRSGMSRRIEFYAIKDNDMHRIGYLIARIVDYSYDFDKGGIRADGCGMDMRFSILNNLNYTIWDKEVKERFPEIEKSFSPEAVEKMGKEKGYRIYDTYFFNANNIREI
jgi:hypothetical protein